MLVLMLLAGVQTILREKLVGFYLYGSLSLGDFDPRSSDVDFLIVTTEDLSEKVLEGLRRAKVGSIGPTTTEALEEFGIHPFMEPSHPKMGYLVKEAAERA